MEFTQSLFSGDESSGMVEARIVASGFSQWPYEVVVVLTEVNNEVAALGN